MWLILTANKQTYYYGLRMAYEVVWGGLIWKAPVEKALRFHHRHPACEVNGGF